MKNEFYYTSADSKTQIHAVEWIPQGEIKGVLQICHGMVEHINRYQEFAEYMTGKGYYVTGHDHLGHGASINSDADYGYFPESRGNQYVVGDIHKLRQMTMKKYPNVPYYMLGHSMGSFLLRQYLTMYGRGLSGAVIMGTGYQGKAILSFGQFVCRLIAGAKGWRYRSKFVNNLAFGGYNKRFEPGETSKEWLTSDRERCRRYVEDPLCSFIFTVAGYYQMFAGMKTLTKKEALDSIPKNIPILFVAGTDDPVGAFGKGVQKVYRKYKAAGIQDVSIKMYENARHEILNEVNREEVYKDIFHWMNGKM